MLSVKCWLGGVHALNQRSPAEGKGKGQNAIISPHANVSNYWRDTHYSYHDDVKSKTFDMSLGLQYKF